MWVICCAWVGADDIVVEKITIMKKLVLLSILASIVELFAFTTVSHALESPQNHLVSLSEIDKTIVIEMRYFGTYNFIGHQVKGYEKDACLLVKEAALALSKIQLALLKKSLSLKVYDCYRPQMAVTEFMTWAKNHQDDKMKNEFYPNEKKNKLIKKGYIAARSGHSRGDSIDLTVIKLPVEEQPTFDVSQQKDCTASAKDRYQDNSLDMGTGYDCFDILSHTMNKKITGLPHKNRLLLKNVMEQFGFRNYKKEWWHFTYVKPYGKKQFYNFPIK